MLLINNYKERFLPNISLEHWIILSEAADQPFREERNYFNKGDYCLLCSDTGQCGALLLSECTGWHTMTVGIHCGQRGMNTNGHSGNYHPCSLQSEELDDSGGGTESSSEGATKDFLHPSCLAAIFTTFMLLSRTQLASVEAVFARCIAGKQSFVTTSVIFALV